MMTLCRMESVMATATKSPPAVINPNFTTNCNEMPEEVWLPFVDQYVAYSLDGREILAGGATYPELFAAMKLKGIERSQVVVGFVE